MDSLSDKLEKVQYLNNNNIDRTHKGFTGQVLIHWYKGEPQKEEITRKKNIDLEK